MAELVGVPLLSAGEGCGHVVLHVLLPSDAVDKDKTPFLGRRI